MNGQNTGEAEPQLLDLLNHLIETTETQLVDQIDYLCGLFNRGESVIEAERVLVVIEAAFGRLLDARDLLLPPEQHDQTFLDENLA